MPNFKPLHANLTLMTFNLDFELKVKCATFIFVFLAILSIFQNLTLMTFDLELKVKFLCTKKLSAKMVTEIPGCKSSDIIKYQQMSKCSDIEFRDIYYKCQ